MNWLKLIGIVVRPQVFVKNYPPFYCFSFGFKISYRDKLCLFNTILHFWIFLFILIILVLSFFRSESCKKIHDFLAVHTRFLVLILLNFFLWSCFANNSFFVDILMIVCYRSRNISSTFQTYRTCFIELISIAVKFHHGFIRQLFMTISKMHWKFTFHFLHNEQQ